MWSTLETCLEYIEWMRYQSGGDASQETSNGFDEGVG